MRDQAGTCLHAVQPRLDRHRLDGSDCDRRAVNLLTHLDAGAAHEQQGGNCRGRQDDTAAARHLVAMAPLAGYGGLDSMSEVRRRSGSRRDTVHVDQAKFMSKRTDLGEVSSAVCASVQVGADASLLGRRQVAERKSAEHLPHGPVVVGLHSVTPISSTAARSAFSP